MPYTATASVATIKLATPVGDDTLLGTVDSSGATRRFLVSDVVSLASGGVSSVNNATGAVVLDAEDVTAVASLNGLTGTITIAAGDNVTVSTAGSTITIAAAAGGGGGGAVDSVNGATGVIVLTASDVTAAEATHASQHQTGGGDEVLPIVTAVSITATANDFSLPTGDIFRLSHGNTTTVNITGLATAVDGAAKLLVNVSTGASSSYTIQHANTNSTAESRFLVPWAGDYVLSPNGGAALVIYDDTDERWRVV
jgi:hypothetical protein